MDGGSGSTSDGGVYWTNRSVTDGAVMRASLLGNDAKPVAADHGPPRARPRPTAVYWTNYEGGEIMKLAK